MTGYNPRIRWARGFFRAWLVLSVIWIFLSISIFHSEIKHKSSDLILIVQSHNVTVDSSFLSLSSEQQNAIVDEIARAMGWYPPRQQPAAGVAKLPDGTILIPDALGAPMPRNITVTLKGGGTHTYLNMKNNVTPEQIASRVQKDLNKAVEHVTWWRSGEVSDDDSLGQRKIVWSTVLFVSGVAIIPVITILILGIMLGWAISGFKRT